MSEWNGVGMHGKGEWSSGFAREILGKILKKISEGFNSFSPSLSFSLVLLPSLSLLSLALVAGTSIGQ